jgi:chemotaxis protein CheD
MTLDDPQGSGSFPCGGGFAARVAPARPTAFAGGDGRTSLYLSPGQMVVAAEPCAVTTVVGSCVAVCVTDPVARVGGMIHYLLPQCAGTDNPLRYGVKAIPQLIERTLALGARRERLEAKVFGGASVLGAMARQGEHLGAKNARVAFELLRSAGISVRAEDVDGAQGRKVIYHTDDGAAWVRRL